MNKGVQYLPHFLDTENCVQPIPVCTIEEMLRDEFHKRKLRNPRFSLRAFALHVGIDSASLSQLLRGRRRVSAPLGAQLLAKLGRKGADCDAALRRIKISAHQRRLLRQIERDDFAPKSARLARRLRLSVDDVNAALTGLLCKGAIRMISSDQWVASKDTS